MMTKYQLVYIKLETTLYKISATHDARKLFRKRKAFNYMKQNALAFRRNNSNKKTFIIALGRALFKRLEEVHNKCN